MPYVFCIIHKSIGLISIWASSLGFIVWVWDALLLCFGPLFINPVFFRATCIKIHWKKVDLGPQLPKLLPFFFFSNDEIQIITQDTTIC